jgi:DNA primase
MNRIAPEDLEGLKGSVDLVALIEASGVALKRRGKSYQGCCPFHTETTASFTVTPAKGLWHCFGCGEGGDAIRFVQKREGLGFREAVERLRGVPARTPSPAAAGKLAASVAAAPAVSPVERGKLLGRVARFYHQRFMDRPEGLQYLAKRRGIRNVTLLRDYQVGYADGSLLEALPKDDERIERFKAIGVLTERGREFFVGCVVFPLFDVQGNVVNLYGRCIEDGEINHWYLPGPKVGLWNYQAAKRSSALLLTESIIDALTLIDRGLADVLPCYGASGLNEDQLELLESCRTVSLTVCFDGDEAGRRGVEKIREQLKGKPLSVAAVSLPAGEDINSFFANHEVADFLALLPVAASARPGADATDTTAPVALSLETPAVERTAQGLIWQLGTRSYEVKAIARQGTQLKATVKASVSHDKKRGFELHTLDLYSARSREAYAGSCAALFEVEQTLIKADLTQMIEPVEAWAPGESAPAAVVELSDRDREAALEWLKDPKLLERIDADLNILGVAGEVLNKQLCYLAVISRKLDDPLSLLIQSRSAAGKSTLQHAVLALVPDEDKVFYTRMTDQALFYQDSMALAHKVLALEEAAGLGGAAYSLRALQSSKQLAIATTTKDPASGKMRTEHYTVQGPVAVLLTTSSASLDEETLSRFLTVTIDESPEMTARIFAEQREADTLEGYLKQRRRAALIARHQAAQRLLEPLAVINPYAPQLTFAARGLRARRDHKKYLMLIKAVAFLHQHQRALNTTRVQRGADDEGEIRYIEVTREDIRHANRLILAVLGASVDELSAPARNLLAHIHAFVKHHCEAHEVSPHEYVFTRKTIREAIGWSDWQVRTHIQELTELEYLKARSGAWGKEYVYELLCDAEPTDAPGGGLALIDPDTLQEPERAL